jgi:hypothetical protein
MGDPMAGNVTDFIEWKRTADSVMLAIYGIDADDAGIEDERLRSHWTTGEGPEAFVEWFALKYDLISKRDIGIEGW